MVVFLISVLIAGLAGRWATGDWVRMSCWQRERALNIGLFKCRCRPILSACGSWFQALVPGQLRTIGSAVVKVGVGLPRHDGEVHDVVANDDALGLILECGMFTFDLNIVSHMIYIYQIYQKDDATMVF